VRGACQERKINVVVVIKATIKIPCSLPTIIPISEIPDNCVLICNGPFCTLACFGSALPSTNCDIVCDDEGNCQLICHFSIGR
jgi:hypothetical protein